MATPTKPAYNFGSVEYGLEAIMADIEQLLDNDGALAKFVKPGDVSYAFGNMLSILHRASQDRDAAIADEPKGIPRSAFHGANPRGLRLARVTDDGPREKHGDFYYVREAKPDDVTVTKDGDALHFTVKHDCNTGSPSEPCEACL